VRGIVRHDRVEILVDETIQARTVAGLIGRAGARRMNA